MLQTFGIHRVTPLAVYVGRHDAHWELFVELHTAQPVMLQLYGLLTTKQDPPCKKLLIM